MAQRLICAAIALAAASAHAQSAPEPAALERTIPRQPIQAAIAQARVSAPAEAKSNSAPKGRFTLGAVNIDGATVFSPKELSQAFEPYLASEVDGAQLFEMAARITERYRRGGYMLSYATIPSQKVQAGMLRLAVVEGRIASITVQGAGADQSAIESITRPLVSESPLRTGTLERALGLIRDLPGLTVTDVALTRSNSDLGLYGLKITVARDRARAFAYADNRGTDSIGRLRLYSSLSLSSLAVAGDELRLDLFAMPGRRFRYVYGQLQTNLPVGRSGLRLALAASKGDQNLHSTQPFEGDSTNLFAQLSYPVLRSRGATMLAKLSVNDWRSLGTENRTRKLRDRLRVARAAIEFSGGSRTQFVGELSLSQGLGFGGMTKVGDPLASRPDASGRFTKAALTVQATRPLSDRVTLQAVMAGQYSKRPLLSAEEFALGGNRIGRAFEFNALTGDRGVGGGLEISYRIADSKGRIANPTLFGFVDGGAVFEAGSPAEAKRRHSLASIGAGTRFTIGGASVSLEAGVPVAARGHDKSVRLFFSTARSF